MRKIIISVFIIMVICFVLIMTYIFSNDIKAEVIGIEFMSYDFEPYDIENYSAQKKVLNLENENIRKLKIKCQITNETLFSYKNIWASFDKNAILPKFVVGDKLETDLPYPIHLEPFSSRTVIFYMLVDATNYSEKNILSELKNIKICITKDGFPGINGYPITEYFPLQ